MDKTLDVDGSVLEGGGQILRMSVAFSAIMGIPIRISKIRLGRSKPGLAAQHLTGLHLVARMCKAKLEGAELGSTSITFTPGRIVGGSYEADPKTAGSISLLLQVALPFALLSDKPVTLNLKGGTNAEMAPQIDYMTEIFRPNLERFGATFDFELYKRGYYPKGGGHVKISVKPVKQFKSVVLMDFGQVQKVYGWSFTAGTLPVRLCYQASDAARNVLSKITDDIYIECYKEAPNIAPNNCNGIVLACETSSGCLLGGSCLGGRNLSPEEVGIRAAREIMDAVDIGSCLDQHAQDQVILYMALASGKSSIQLGELTMHTKTAIYVAEMFTKVKFNITKCGENNIVECDGLGYVNKNM